MTEQQGGDSGRSGRTLVATEGYFRIGFLAGIGLKNGEL